MDVGDDARVFAWGLLMKPYYQDDWVTLYHGDCLEVTEWLSADVLVTDPPYGVSNESRKGRYQSTRRQIRQAAPIIGDSSVELRDKMLKLWGSGPRVVFGTWRAPRPEPVDYRLIWHKAGSMPGPTNAAFMSQDEEIYITGTGFVRTSPPLRSVIRTSEIRSNEVAAIGHPTPKPLGLMQILVGRCPPGVVADPFAGSGSTLVAVKSFGRRAVGVELDERYCEIAANLLSQDMLVLEGV